MKYYLASAMGTYNLQLSYFLNQGQYNATTLEY